MSLATKAVAVMLPISDPDRSKEFYANKLGLPFEGMNEEQSPVFRLSGGTQLVLLPRPDEKPLRSTAMSFEVADVAAEVADLETRGVVFEDYDLPDLKTVNHIAETDGVRAAWFLDPDGNVLCVHTR
jgi:catechol 2,3-dioxygenase-like lactoylglutathione lyase family enzyme